MSNSNDSNTKTSSTNEPEISSTTEATEAFHHHQYQKNGTLDLSIEGNQEKQKQQQQNHNNNNSNKNCDTKNISIDSGSVNENTTSGVVTASIKTNGIVPNSIQLTLKEEKKSPIKSILTTNNTSNGDLSSSSLTANGGNNTTRKSIKKSVTFDPESEIVKKFIEGEVIVDKRNPFKNGSIQTIDNSSSTSSAISQPKKVLARLRLGTSISSATKKQQQQKVSADDTEFVTKEQVLKESKYVKTYIKNPDKYFTYDPTIIAKIKFEELRELRNKKPPRRIRLSSQTQERLKELKKSQEIVSKQSNGKSKIPSYKKVSKSNYPDLSDIKVKVGTDLEESFFNPEEVTINAKKFDECVKKLQISCDDDLDEIDTGLTKSDSSDELKTTTTAEKEKFENNLQNINKDEKKSFTNTVNSKEFQEFLDKKGLLLTPKKAMLNGDISSGGSSNKKYNSEENGKTITNNSNNKTNQIIMSNNNLNSIITTQNNNHNNNNNNNNLTTVMTSTPVTTAMMEPKKVKKPSMFQRLLPTSIFSSKRKTTPKETVPITHNLYTTTPSTNSSSTPQNCVIVDGDNNKLLKSSMAVNASPIKRVVLERQSFHGGTTIINSSSNSANDLRKCIERSRKSYGGDDRSSSISSALTNAEEIFSTDRQSNDLKSGISSETVELKKSSKEQLNSIKPMKTTKIKKTSSRERLQNAQQHSKTVVDGRDMIIKPRAQKLQSSSGSINKSVSSKMMQKIDKSDLRRSLEKQCPPKRSTSFEDYGNSRRSSSLGRYEAAKKLNSLPKSLSQQRTSSKTDNSITLETSKEDSMENGPKSTSTPLRNDEKVKQIEAKIPTIPPPREYSSPAAQTPTKTKTTYKTFDVSPEEWARLQEIKEKTDRELFNRVTPVQATIDKNATNIVENIYEKLPSGRNVEQQQPSSLQYRPEYAQINQEMNFVRGSPQRNTFSGVPSSSASSSSNRHVKVIDGTGYMAPQNMPKVIKTDYAPKQRMEPPRSQSVMDEMITGHQQPLYGSIAGTPVIMRRKGGRVLSREEILNKVKEFCRKSMNRTPTNNSSGGSSNQPPSIKEEKISSNISPVSYASVDLQNRIVNNKIVAPQVPQRIQSLQSPINSNHPNQFASLQTSSSPVYAHVMKRSSIQSNMSDVYDSPQRRITTPTTELHPPNLRPRASTLSDTDSVFLPVNRPSSSSPSGRYMIVDGPVTANNNGPMHPVKYQQTTMPNPYGYIQLKPQQLHQTRTTEGGGNGSNGMGGGAVPNPTTYRDSPTIFQHSPRYHSTQPILEHHQQQQQFYYHQQQQQHQQRPVGSVVYLKVKDQVYTPIANSLAGKNFIQSQSPSIAKTIPPSPTTSVSLSASSSSGRRVHVLPPYESESGSEAGEVQRILQNRKIEEDWQNEKSGRNQSGDQSSDDRRRAARREDPRRHTLGGDMLQYGPGGQGQMQQQRAMDLEMGTRAQKSKKAPPVRGYTPINQGPLFDEDPGIMSEVETASTGFRRGGKQRSSLPVVRTPSKTLERPLGLVFLQYRSETKRALLPNEITSIDTVRALFVRSFPRQLTMAYLEGPNVKIYIHDASKDMFYELEDVRSHLREIRDRSVLRLFESNEVAAPQVLPGGPGVPQPLPPPTGSGHWDQEQSYFSEPEFDSEYQHQHIHKSKGSKPAPYYVGATQSMPRALYSDRNKNAVGAPVKPLRSYGSRGSMGPAFPYTPDQLYSIPDGYTSSPERGTRSSYEEPYYSQYGTRGGTVTPIIDEEHRCEGPIPEDQYALYGMKVTGRIPRAPNQLYDPTRPEDLHRIRVEHMERQLANLTGLVQKALNQNPQMAAQVNTLNANYLTIPGHCRAGLEDMDGHSSGSSTSIQDKSVSFEKSVSFSDDIQGVPKSHSPQHTADTKPPKPAIKSSTLPRTSSQERDRLKPPPPPKPLTLAGHPNYRPDIALAPEVYNHLRGLQKKAKDLRMEVRTLRRLSQAQAVAVREDIKDAFMRIRATLLASTGSYWGQGDQEKTRISREEELYKQEVIRLEKDLTDLETSVEGLRGEVINRRTRVNMAAVEDMALVLSRASKTVAELKMRFPGLSQGLRNILANEMEKVVREEKFLKEEPDRLESALRRCKKLTGTLVTLKRLASVQEQRLPVVEPINEDPPRSAEISSGNKPVPSPRLGSITVSGGVPPENALDALLDELQTFAKPQPQQTLDPRPDDSTSDDSSQTLQNTITTQHSQGNMLPTAAIIDPNNLAPQSGGTIITTTNLTPNTNGFNQSNLRRLHSYPSGSDTDTSPPQPSRPVGKPPVPERNAELLSKVSNKRIPPPPPPRTSSRSPLASPTSPNVPQRLPSVSETDHQSIGNGGGSGGQDGSGNSSGNESGNDHVQRQLALEMRHQELLKKQKLLQEQYARLQAMSKNSIALPPSDIIQLKKTGSESNLPQKMGLSLTVTGSMKNLNAEINITEKNEKNLINSTKSSVTDDLTSSSSSSSATATAVTANSIVAATATPNQTTTNKVYETDIL